MYPHNATLQCTTTDYSILLLNGYITPKHTSQQDPQIVRAF